MVDGLKLETGVGRGVSLSLQWHLYYVHIPWFDGGGIVVSGRRLRNQKPILR